MDVSVVIASHDRPIRLRRLLDALAAQDISRERFEVIVAHDSTGPETADLLRRHALTGAGVLRHLSFDPGPGPASKRNAAWTIAHAPLIAFTDDDCRPPREWLGSLLGATAAAGPGAVIQGTTRPDPDELGLLHAAPHVRTQTVDPPSLWAQTCNIAYPRELLERLGGFDETLPVASGEDVDLALRARAAGAVIVAAPDVLTYHAVEILTLSRRLADVWRWQHLAAVVAAHPALRDELTGRIFWKREHAYCWLAAVALIASRHRRSAAFAALPWLCSVAPSYGSTRNGRLRALAELPAHALVSACETAALARGSVRHRSVLL